MCLKGFPNFGEDLPPGDSGASFHKIAVIIFIFFFSLCDVILDGDEYNQAPGHNKAAIFKIHTLYLMVGWATSGLFACVPEFRNSQVFCREHADIGDGSGLGCVGSQTVSLFWSEQGQRSPGATNAGWNCTSFSRSPHRGPRTALL